MAIGGIDQPQFDEYQTSGTVYVVSGNMFLTSGNVGVSSVTSAYVASGNVNTAYYPTGMTRTYPIGINCTVSGTIASGATFSGTYAASFDGYVKSIAFNGYTQTSDIINAYIGSPGTRITENLRLDTIPVGVDLTVPMSITSGTTLNIYYTSLGSKAGDVNINVEFLR